MDEKSRFFSLNCFFQHVATFVTVIQMENEIKSLVGDFDNTGNIRETEAESRTALVCTCLSHGD